MARALRYPFLDCDTLVEAAAGASVAQIFADEGEEAFRDLETQVLQACGNVPCMPLARLTVITRRVLASAFLMLANQ